MPFTIEYLSAPIEVRVNHAIGRHLLYHRRFPVQIDLPADLYDELLRMRVPNYLEFTPDGRVLYNGVGITKNTEIPLPRLQDIDGKLVDF